MSRFMLLTVLLSFAPGLRAAEKEFRGTIETVAADARFDTAHRHFHTQDYLSINQVTPSTIGSLHKIYVDEFTRQPGFGVGRSGPFYPETPKHWVELVPESEGSRIRDFGKAKTPPRYDLVKETLHFADGQTETVRERVWLLKQGQLLSTGEKPEAYITATSPNMHELFNGKQTAKAASIKKRAATEFESLAVAELKKGKDIAFHVSETEMLVVGALRAEQTCAKCHNVEGKTLLGAFTYTLLLQSEATPEKHRLSNLKGLSRIQRGAVDAIEAIGGKFIRDGDGPIVSLQLGFVATEQITAAKPRWVASTHVLARDSVISQVSAFPDLVTLDISNTLISDASIDEIAKLPKLKKLIASNSRITKKGITTLKSRIANLEVVNAIVAP